MFVPTVVGAREADRRRCSRERRRVGRRAGGGRGDRVRARRGRRSRRRSVNARLRRCGALTEVDRARDHRARERRGQRLAAERELQRRPGRCRASTSAVRGSSRTVCVALRPSASVAVSDSSQVRRVLVVGRDEAAGRDAGVVLDARACGSRSRRCASSGAWSSAHVSAEAGSGRARAVARGAGEARSCRRPPTSRAATGVAIVTVGRRADGDRRARRAAASRRRR